jgi:hypothetical protein
MQAAIKGKGVILEDVRVSLVSGAGYIFMGPGTELSEGEYELTLEDGRSCAVQVVSIKDYIARFRCLGPLEYPHVTDEPAEQEAEDVVRDLSRGR